MKKDKEREEMISSMVKIVGDKNVDEETRIAALDTLNDIFFPPKTKDGFDLIPGVKSKPLFKTEKEYEEFRERFSKTMKPVLDEQQRQRALSWLDAENHLLD